MLYLFILRMSYSIKRGMKEAGWDYNKSDIPKSGIIKTPTRKISAQKIPTWSIHSQIFKYSHMGFLNLFCFLLSSLSLILFKRLFCNPMFQKCWSQKFRRGCIKENYSWLAKTVTYSNSRKVLLDKYDNWSLL